tara:strand:- start:5610 stop:5891 length:282 start_codon:yes stop_codon:yes gene_type:complete
MRLKRENWDRTLVGYSWKSDDEEMRGHRVDNLNKKQFSEAENLYEKIFILMRDEIVDNCQSLMMGNEIDRLTLCQVLAGLLTQNKELKLEERS